MGKEVWDFLTGVKRKERKITPIMMKELKCLFFFFSWMIDIPKARNNRDS